jgi:hypothetical protein
MGVRLVRPVIGPARSGGPDIGGLDGSDGKPRLDVKTA